MDKEVIGGQRLLTILHSPITKDMMTVCIKVTGYTGRPGQSECLKAGGSRLQEL